MDAHSLERLEFTRICTLLERYARSAPGRARCRRLTPGRSRGQVGRWLDQVREMRALMERIGGPPLGGIHDVDDAVRRAGVSGPLEPEDLSRIADTLEATRRICHWFDPIDDSTPLIRHLGERIGDFGALADQIRRAIDPGGEVRDDASKRLLRIRMSIEEARRHINKVFDRLLKNTQITRWLQYGSTTFHNDRTVLPLRAEHRGRVPGIIHRSSETGATLFVEPAEAVQLNNTIIQLREDEHAEIGRVLTKLSQVIHMNAEEIGKTLKAVSVLDLIHAKVTFGRAYEMSVPTLTEHSVALYGARHPLLLELHRKAVEAGRSAQPVVPIDIRLGDDFDMLVITGPNTGGKTVAIKTLGLLCLMTQAGLPIPTRPGAELCVFDDILIDVGDEQSLQQSLSTFSAHMAQLLRMVQRANRKTLLLVDELGSGTDPDEGAAIGRAMMEEFLSIGCLSMVTTHLGALKSIGFSHDRVENACVEFDPVTLRPTYHLRIGEPGNSNALAIARRLGVPKQIVRNAEGFLSEQHKAFKQAIAGTLESRRLAEKARGEAAEAKAATERERQTLERKKHELQRERSAFEQWMREVSSLRPGDKVHVPRFDREGTVIRLQLQKQSALISVGALEMELPLTELRPAAQ